MAHAAASASACRPELLVYEKLGLSFLRRAWVNSDQFWASAFILAGLATLIT